MKQVSTTILPRILDNNIPKLTSNSPREAYHSNSASWSADYCKTCRRICWPDCRNNPGHFPAWWNSEASRDSWRWCAADSGPLNPQLRLWTSWKLSFGKSYIFAGVNIGKLPNCVWKSTKRGRLYFKIKLQLFLAENRFIQHECIRKCVSAQLALVLGIPVQIVGGENARIASKKHVEVKTRRFKDSIGAAIDVGGRVELANDEIITRPNRKLTEYTVQPVHSHRACGVRL